MLDLSILYHVQYERVKREGFLMSKFPSRLREIRVANKRKQREVAEYLGIKTRSYQAYEGGTRVPSIDLLIILADYFGVTLDYLVGRTDEPSSGEMWLAEGRRNEENDADSAAHP